MQNSSFSATLTNGEKLRSGVDIQAPPQGGGGGGGRQQQAGEQRSAAEKRNSATSENDGQRARTAVVLNSQLAALYDD